MHHLSLRRCGAALSASVLASAIAFAGVASSADAATIYACQKKKGGTIRLVSKKTKCKKKTEKKLSWSTRGKTGRNGTNGTNGAAGANGSNGAPGAPGANGAPGQPQSALSFAVSRAIDNSNKDTLFSAGGATVKFNCGTILLANVANVEVNAASGTAQAGAVYLRTDDTATQSQQQQIFAPTLNGTDQVISQVVTNATGTLGNKGHVSGTIRTASSVIFLDYFVQVSSGSAACVVRGHALVIPAAT